nr:zinc finger protein 16-like [Aedes albopictus]
MNFGNQPAASTSKANYQECPQEEQSTDSAVCRVCMGWSSDSGLMVGLFEGQIQGTILAEVLALVGAVNLATEHDRLPKWCCKECLKALESAYKLRMLCQDSDWKLRHAFSTDEETVVVVKKEVEEDKSDRDEMLDVEEAVVSESLQLPKLEIMDYVDEDQIEQMTDGEDDMVEADGGAESDGDEAGEDQDEKMSEEVDKRLDSDVFDRVKAVGFKCCGCKVVFNTSKELAAHSKEAHADKKLSRQELERKNKKQCDICYRVLCNDITVWKHQLKDTLNYRCKVCGDLFWSWKKVKTHYKRVHGPNPVGPSKACCACREQFETEEQLREHSEAIHLPQKPVLDPARPLTCNICYRCFKSDAQLYAHQSRLLESTKKHQCIQCGLAFRYPRDLKYHELTHTGEKVFRCPKCPKAYSNYNTYKKHVVIHDIPADKYKCEICGYKCKTRYGLERHTIKHTGERPHKCPHCPATFSLPHGLNSHLLTHTDEKTQGMSDLQKDVQATS